MPSLLPPREHRVSRSIDVPADVDDVWRRISSFGEQPSWRKGLTEVERLPDRDGLACWAEDGDAFLTVESSAPSRLVRRIADPGAWGGQWEIDLAAAEDACRVTITEGGWVANPVLRLISKYLIGHTRTIDIYLSDLARSYSVQEPRPRDA